MSEQGTAKRQRAEDDAPAKRQRTDDDGQAGFNGAGPSESALDVALAVQQEIIDLDNECAAAILRIEQEYMRRKEPVFEKREQALSKMTGFWFSVLVQSPISPYISEPDKAILTHLEKLNVISDPETARYTLQLVFSPNEYFNNRVLERAISRNDDGYTVVVCATVDWREGHDLQSDVNEAGEPLIDEYSFFNWFLTEGVYEEATGDAIAEIIRTQIWSNPMLIFAGDYSSGVQQYEVVEDDEAGDEDQEGEEEEEEDDGDEDQGQEEEDEDEEEEDDNDEDGGEEDEEEEEEGGDDDEDDAL